MAYALILGAGMVGVGTALALQAEGKDVILVDKSAPGTETSYGNAGAIQAEAVEPYPIPLDIATLFKIAIGADNNVHYHLDALPSNFGPLYRYFRNSFPARHKILSREYAQLIEQSIPDHSKLIEESKSEHLIRRTGMRRAHRSQESLDAAAMHAEYIHREYGVGVRIEDKVALHEAEPELKPGLVGSIHWTDTWSVRDPGGLVKTYAALFVERGGVIVEGDARTLSKSSSDWSVQSSEGPLSAEHAVIALGPWASDMLPLLGYKNPLFHKRGYHLHFAAPEGGNRSFPRAPMMDVAYAVVVTATELGIRVCSGAEIARQNAPPDPRQLYKGVEAVKELFDLGPVVEGTPWVGNRPCMPDMLPVVGKAPAHENLWFNFGHGHQGFTMGPTTGRMLAEEMISGLAPQPALAPLGRVRPLRK
ncbi:MAG: amino acid dehydrogenase [Rhodospirillaceae bacterium]|nr:amino acid dehydrogenase [Rhodospirillaceae bacterium]|tara:strand:+ start:9472 stop:10731 length:1260 start_codon:yes stop_codon:yes gene_type:complete